MQKKIIALAVAGLMSGAAFAQTNVTISGVWDVGYLSSKTQGNNGATETNAAGSNTATSGITFRAQEDLGGGMKAGAQITTEPGGNAGNGTGVAFANSQNFVFLGGNFGEVSLGLRNNFSLTTALAAQPFGTGIGGGYSGAFGRLDGVGHVGALAASTSGIRDVRANNSIRYDSPKFNGFSAGVSIKAKNSGHVASNSDGHMNVGLNYNAGPLNVSYAYADISNPTAAAASIGKVKHNLLGANYTFGTFTLYGGYTTSKGDAAAANDTNARSMNVALKWMATSNIAVMANVLRDNDKMAANQDRKLNALGLDYMMSKRTAVYARYEGGDTDKSNGAAGKFTRYAAGLRHSF